MNVGAICNREVIIVERDDELVEAARLMRDHHVGCVVVVEPRREGNVPVGMLTDRDIVVGVVAEDAPDIPRLTGGDVMSYDLLVARQEDDLEEAIERMRRDGVRRMPVVSAEGTLAGLLALDDVLDQLAADLGQVAGVVAREQERERLLRS